MTCEEMLKSQPKKRKKPSSEEHRIQCSCVRWFRLQYPQLAMLLFAVPNGGLRSKSTAASLKAEGTLSGVSDLILLKSNGVFSSLCIEMKAGRNKQLEEQVKWQEAAEKTGNKYVVCYSLDEFMNEVNNYLNNK